MSSKDREFVFEPVPAPLPWQAFRMHTGKYPIPKEERPRLAEVAQMLSQTLCAALNLTPSVWIDTAELHRDGASSLISPNARAWGPTMGFAFDPTGEPPRSLTLADFMDVDFGTPPPIFMRSAIFVSKPNGTEGARKVLTGRGLQTLLLLNGTADAFMKNTLQSLLPLIKEREFQTFRFYLPLLHVKSLEKVHAEDLDAWLGNAQVYIREVFEEGALLLLARTDLEARFRALGMRRLGEGDGPVAWSLSLATGAGGKPGGQS